MANNDYKFKYDLFNDKLGKNVIWLISEGKVIRPTKLVLRLNKASVEFNVEIVGIGNNVNIELLNDVLISDKNGITIVELDSRQFGSDAMIGLTGYIRSDVALKIEMVNILTEGLIHEISEEESTTLTIRSFNLNDGDIFSSTQTVIAKWQTNLPALQYRISRYESFDDSEWKANTGQCTFELYQVGVNKVYLQVRNDSTDESNIVSSMIAWHGMEVTSCVDNVEIVEVSLIDEVQTSKHFATVESYEDDVAIEAVVVTDDAVIHINDVQVYPVSEGV